MKADILTLCDDALAALAVGPARDSLLQVRANLFEPLQVTVAGGVSSGKSTLVNALLGQRVAAVDAGECTRVVTRFRYSHHERAEVVLHDGTTRTVHLRDGTLPAELGVPVDQVRQVVVHLSNSGLTDLGIVDTPGLNTVTAENQEQTAGFLGLAADTQAGRDTAASIGQADALIFLMPHLRQADVDVLSGFRDLYDGTGLSSFNAVAVLSKIDRLTRTGDPVVAAAPIVERVAAEAKGLVSEVFPVIGLLAETASTARLTEDDARALAALAAFGDDLDREDLLLSPEAFLRHTGAAVSVEVRRRLLDEADLYGLGVALDAVDRGVRGAAGLLRVFEERSGLAPLRAMVLGRLGRQADLIKAHTALCDLRRVSYLRVADPREATVLRGLRSPLDRLELDPTLHHLRVVQVLHDAGSGELVLPEPLLRDLEQLAAGTDPTTRTGVSALAEVPGAALAGAARWGTWGNDPRRRPADARRARSVKEAYELLWNQHADEAAHA